VGVGVTQHSLKSHLHGKLWARVALAVDEKFRGFCHFFCTELGRIGIGVTAG
jgi:hypothetical protein